MMVLLCRQHVAASAALLVGITFPTAAFVMPTNPQVHATTTTRHIQVGTVPQVMTRLLQQQPAFTTALGMGVFEDLLQGQDVLGRDRDNAAYLQTLQSRVERINGLEAEMEELGDEELEAKADEFRTRLAKGEDLNGNMLEEAFAVVREAAW
jgi:hypothetical protein